MTVEQVALRLAELAEMVAELALLAAEQQARLAVLEKLAGLTDG